MSGINGFIISLISAAAVSGIIEGIVPEKNGEMKKYLRYLIALAILLTLLSPLKELVGAIPEYTKAALDEFDYSSVEAAARVNSLIALHIADAVAERFDIDADLISAELSSELEMIRLSVPKGFGIFASDIEDYISSSYDIKAEVTLYER